MFQRINRLGMTHLPYYKFPSTLVLVDDIETTLEEISNLFEDMPQKNVTFSDSHEALAFINTNSMTPSQISPDTWDGVITNDTLYDCHKEIYNPERFNQVSCVILDYDMPGMNGLTLCESIKDSRIKKILLTGVADEQIAISAFNRGLIDYFIRKHDPNSPELVMQFVQDAIDRFFYDQTNPLIENIIKQSPWVDSPLKQSDYEAFFISLVKKLDLIEYYLIDISGIFLAVDAHGSIKIIQTFSENSLQQHTTDMESIPYWQHLNESEKELIAHKEKVLVQSTILDADDTSYCLSDLYPVPNCQSFVAVFTDSKMDKESIKLFKHS